MARYGLDFGSLRLLLLCCLAAACGEPALAQNRPAKGAARFAVSGTQGLEENGRRKRAAFELDAYGPLPFPETVAAFVASELDLILELQDEDGSFRFLKERKTEAGGTIERVTQASLSGVSLRKHAEVDPDRIEPAVAKALDYVVRMVRRGKLRTDVSDASWRHAYALRFLVHEFPHVTDERTRVLVEDACLLLLHELAYLQQGTTSQRSRPAVWRRAGSPGLWIEDDPDSGLARVARCDGGCPAHAAGMRAGDVLVSANGEAVHTAIRYALARQRWRGGDTVAFRFTRDGEPRAAEVLLPALPGTLGLELVQTEPGDVRVRGFEALGNPGLADIRIGDRVLRVDGEAVTTLDALQARKWTSAQGVELELQRGGATHAVVLTCVPVEAADFGVGIPAGIDHSSTEGLAIGNLAQSSCLGKAGLQKGDRLLRLGDARLLNRRHLRELERSFHGGQVVPVTYLDGDTHERKTVEVVAGAKPYRDWPGQGYSGVELANAPGGGAVVRGVGAGSPAEVGGCRAGDVIRRINGVEVNGARAALGEFAARFAGQRCRVEVTRDGKPQQLEWTANRPNRSPWISGKPSKSGGWVYYKYVRGGTTFLTSDLLRILLQAREVMPFEIPDEMIHGPFEVLSNLRLRQPNSEIGSYRYDAGGSFWGVKDIRGDIGRLAAAELSLVMYCEAGFDPGGRRRTQGHLARALREWERHRGVLEFAKTGGHQAFGIAPWSLPYAYRTALEAARHLTEDDELRGAVQRSALKLYFQYAREEYVEDLGGEGWFIGYYKKKAMLRPCLVLDGLATMKHLYRPDITVGHPALRPALAEFRAARYGAAHRLLETAETKGADDDKALGADIRTLREAVEARYGARLRELREILERFPEDAREYLEQTLPHFEGHPKAREMANSLAK